MSKITDIVTQFQTYIETALASGGTLSYMRKMDWGARDEIFKENEVPFGIISMTTGVIEPHSSSQESADFVITVSIKNAKQKGSNAYYDGTDGIVYDLEKVLNVVRQDLDFNSKARIMLPPDWIFTEDGDFIICDINFPFVSNPFDHGSI